MHARKRISAKLQNPRINYITLYTLRHWKATTEYAKTKDILHVMKMLGHRNINACMMQAGFEYVCTHESKMIFRKRK